MTAKLALYTQNSEVIKALSEAARSSEINLRLNPPLSFTNQEEFVVCDIASFIIRKKDLKRIQKGRLYLISNKSNEDNIRLIHKYKLKHLVGMNEGTYAPELMAHLNKVIKRKIWGIKAYISDDSEFKTCTLGDSTLTDKTIDETLGALDLSDYFSSLIEYLKLVANELITNSLYKGPNLRRCKQGLESLDRYSPVFLADSDHVRITIAKDNKGLALSVLDTFGGLTYELVISSLMRSFKDKTVMDKKDGAGLGLYLTFLHSNQFIVNFREDCQTEVICVIDKEKRYKQYKERIRSFHFFQEARFE
jgi:sigma-B regulation protein RsbU (phosphoserine phosphatase)